jgi:N-acyl-D-amino-acid deacylase
MKRLLKESLEDGAIGMSTGMIYAPCVYADTSELIELCKIVAEYSGVFVIHMRDEGERLLESIDEVIKIAEESDVHAHISHFKAGGKRNWGKSTQALQKLEEAKDMGIQISYDHYPYTAGSTFLSSLLPSWVHEGGVEKMLNRLKDPGIQEKIREDYGKKLESGRATGWDKVLVTYVESSKNKNIEGKSLEEISKIRRQSPINALMDLIIEEKNTASMASFTMSEEDVKRIMSNPLGMVCTDGLLLGKPHPRAYGAFPRVLSHYTRDQKILRIEEAIRRMTGYPARVFNLGKRGYILPDYIADLVIFDPKIIKDTSTFEDPRQFPEGIKHVIVSGELSVKNGKFTEIKNGKIIKS